MDEIDIKAMTSKLQEGDGCSLKYALQHSRFDEQEGVFEAIRAEAYTRGDRSLSFDKRIVKVDLPNGQDSGDRIPVLDIRKDGTLIWEVFKPPKQDAVFGACRVKDGAVLEDLKPKN